ncbi:hypothetical protein Ocin01_08204 [Orchesella cincta]|uniref:Uncharacterized protein n=1 Tax=Orchesella cincta TaxID=48709 RepID=A0A1D2MZM5_ORCCI|nr:hypothetical protein Ocin01_08204 [Orchesella cincta]
MRILLPQESNFNFYIYLRACLKTGQHCNSCHGKYSETLFVQDDAQVPRKDIMINKILSYVMDASMLPPLLTLITYGKSEDSIYVSILLELMMHFPVDHFKPFQAFGTQTQNVYKVIFDSETSGDVITRVNQDPEYEIEADADFLVNINGAWWWSSKCCFHLLASIRQNLEFVNSRRVFDLWNANISRIISCCYARYLPQFADVITLQQTNENGETHASQDVIRCILEKLDLTIQSWSKLVGKTVLESSSTTDSTSLQMHDITLAFYFFYVLFTGKEIFQLVDNLFVERLCTLLENCTEQHSLTQEVKDESMWIQTSFYYRIALVIASPLSQKYLSKLLDQFESMLLEVDESQQNFKNDVMTYQSSVFAFLLRHNVYSNYVSLVEMWAEVDKESCRSFYIDGKFDDELNTAVNNSLIALAAKGNLEISKLVVELADKRKAHKFSLDFNYVKTNMYGLIQKIPLDDDEGDEDPNNLERFSNVIQIAMKDQYLFCFEMQSPTDFLHHIIKVMLKFHNVSMIGKSCLELISKMLVNIRTLQNVNQYLTNHEQFIRFLGSQIGKLEKDVEETVFVFTLLASLIKHNLEKFTNNVNNQKSSWITWELTSVFSYIHRVPKLEILEFLLAIFKTNFKCPLIQIAELGLPSSDFGKILLNLLFHLQALLHKVAFQEPKEAIWEILYEILRHAEQGTGIQHSTFQTDVLFQPWMKVTMTFLLSQCVFPSAAPMMSLEFMRKWTKMILLYVIHVQ